MPGRIRVVLALNAAQASKIRHFWSFERMLGQGDKNPLHEDPLEPSKPCRDASYLEYDAMRVNGDIGEVIRLADGSYIYRYEGERRQGFPRPKYEWLKEFSLESLPVLAYEADDPDLPWFYPVTYDPDRELADRNRT